MLLTAIKPANLIAEAKMKKYKDDYSRESAIKRDERMKQARKDEAEYQKEYKRLIREHHGLNKKK